MTGSPVINSCFAPKAEVAFAPETRRSPTSREGPGPRSILRQSSTPSVAADGGQVTYMQFMEDTYGTASTFRSGGTGSERHNFIKSESEPLFDADHPANGVLLPRLSTGRSRPPKRRMVMSGKSMTMPAAVNPVPAK